MRKVDISQATDAGDAPLRGMVLAILGLFLLPCMDAVAKILGEAGNTSPGFITFARFVIQLIFCFLILVWSGKSIKALRPNRFWINFLRGMLIALASLLFFTAVKYMPLADAIAVFFVEPLILTLLSVVILRETVGWRRILAVIAGFLGAVIVVQPSYTIFGPISLLPLGTATLFSFYLLLNRVAGKGDSAWVMQFTAALGGVFVLGLAMIIGTVVGADDLSYALPALTYEWGLLLLMGMIGVTGHFFVVRAFQMAPASLLAPFQYVEIVAAVILGYLLFEDFPSASKWLGIMIIVGSGLYVFFRERRKNVVEKSPSH